jgi:hypothetical protein
MTNEKLTELLKIAYRWGRDNGEGRSEKNFNDLLQTEAINQALRIHDVIKSVCVSCGKPVKDFDEETNNCCDECWLSA